LKKKECNDVLNAVSNCRVCGNNFFSSPLLTYENMPSAAQHLPDANNLKNDESVTLEVFQCSGCGLVQLSNKPVDYYREVIRAAGISDEMKQFRSKQFRNFIEKFNLKNKKIIEVGCGKGEYLSIMSQQGAQTFGLEFSEESVVACNKLGLSVTRGYIESNHEVLQDSPFDGFFILNFLEHLPNINSVLGGIHKNLCASGVGLVEVPNFDMILQKNLYSEFIGDHLFYFTRETLENTLKMNGFEIIDSAIVWHDYVISAHVKKIEANRKTPILVNKVKIDNFSEHQQKIKNELQEYLNAEDKKVAIWGAGHQSLAVIALADLADKISYVVDSATFKQNKFTPATHIPIVAPETLLSDPVDAVIIMAASYSDEVARNLLKSHQNKLSISILREEGLEILKA
jgi:2-polyprenyl-3-methyl-5-hydroxy-6-metoxy-1,4-benzoquinol methylase